MSFCLTLQKFPLSQEVTAIPKMVFDTDGADYWLLLNTFEKIEEKTGKLIDIGDSVAFSVDEMILMLEVLHGEISELEKEIDPEELFEKDSERKMVLLKKLQGMTEIGIKENVSLLGITENDE